MNYDPEIYNAEKLHLGDKQTLEVLHQTKKSIFDKENINEYVQSNYEGRFTTALIKELLSSFVEFLDLQMEYCINDFIIDTIESYDDDEIENENARKEAVA